MTTDTCPRCGSPEIYEEGDYEWCGACEWSDGTPSFTCPTCGDEWEYDPDKAFDRSRAMVDIEMHWEQKHGGLIPEHVEFGNFQCPGCHDPRGLDGSVSCSTCGHIPEEVRA